MSTAIAGTLIGLASTSAYATNGVPCDSNEYVSITTHGTNAESYTDCYANPGESSIFQHLPPNNDAFVWVTQIWTGNNRVQWYGDGRWQPDQPIGKWTEFTWPNHPGGVKGSAIRLMP